MRVGEFVLLLFSSLCLLVSSQSVVVPPVHSFSQLVPSHSLSLSLSRPSIGDADKSGQSSLSVCSAADGENKVCLQWKLKGRVYKYYTITTTAAKANKTFASSRALVRVADDVDVDGGSSGGNVSDQ